MYFSPQKKRIQLYTKNNDLMTVGQHFYFFKNMKLQAISNIQKITKLSGTQLNI